MERGAQVKAGAQGAGTDGHSWAVGSGLGESRATAWTFPRPAAQGPLPGPHELLMTSS